MNIDVVGRHVDPVLVDYVARVATSARERSGVLEPRHQRGASATSNKRGSQERVRDTDGEGPTGAHAHGVVRHLLEGHFRVVADLRLRINFREALTLAETKATKQAATDHIDEIVDFVAATLGSDPALANLGEETEAAIGELRETFNATVSELAEEFGSGDDLQADGLTSGVRSAFDALLESLRLLLSSAGSSETQAEGSVSEATARAEDESTTSKHPDAATELPPAFHSLLDQMTASFETLLKELVDSLNGATVLREPSEPRGNGVAYSRFLSIYEGLQNSADSAEKQAAVSIDTTA